MEWKKERRREDWGQALTSLVGQAEEFWFYAEGKEVLNMEVQGQICFYKDHSDKVWRADELKWRQEDQPGG